MIFLRADLVNKESKHSNEEDEFAPNLGSARITAHMAHAVVIKLKEMDLPESLDGDLARFSTDLSDLWNTQKELSRRLESLLKVSDQWGVMGDLLVDIRSNIEHMAWHMKSIRRPLAKITRYAYRKDLDSK